MASSTGRGHTMPGEVSDAELTDEQAWQLHLGEET